MRPHDQALVADTAHGTLVLTEFGTAAERQAIGDWLRSHLVLADEDVTHGSGAVPATWQMTSDAGSTILRKIQPRTRAIRSLIAWLVTAIVSAGWLASLGDATSPGSAPALALTLLLAFGSAVSTWGRLEWTVRSGELTFQRRFLSWQRERTFTRAALEVTQHTDSDNDRHYKLVVVGAERRKTIHSQMNDSGEVVDLARWLEVRTGFRLTLPRELRPSSKGR
jgi:hypothetical protein